MELDFSLPRVAVEKVVTLSTAKANDLWKDTLQWLRILPHVTSYLVL
jgi:hypothetical protein